MLYSISQICEITGMSPRTVKSRLRTHLEPQKVGRALKYDTRLALPLLYQEPADEREYHLAEERARLVFHQANVAAMEEAERRGSLIPAGLVSDLGAALVVAARTRILNIHSHVRSRFPTLDREVADEVERLSLLALKELGNDGLPEELRSRLATAGTYLEPTTEAVDQ